MSPDRLKLYRLRKVLKAIKLVYDSQDIGLNEDMFLGLRDLYLEVLADYKKLINDVSSRI